MESIEPGGDINRLEQIMDYRSGEEFLVEETDST
jgi:hypothetical protein